MLASKTSEPHTGRVALVTGAAHGIGQAIAAVSPSAEPASFSATSTTAIRAASCRSAGDGSGPSYAPVGFEVADCDVAAASWEAVFDLVEGISCDPLRASGFDSSG
jgi:NAD(P)-dependent dehydrogenase (short-subunit alcohol dehydrogenase family)